MEDLVTDAHYRGRRVLVTGHTGFKGGWLSLWLHRLGAEVHGLALPCETAPNFHEIIGPGTFAREWFVDLRSVEAVREAVAATRPDLIFHLAAQPLVQRSYRNPLETLGTNVLGTAHVLEAVRLERLPCDVVVITSDKCYANAEWEYAYRENDPLGGRDPYSMSKAATELVAQSWRGSFFQGDPALGRVVTARAGNVIGGGDFAENRILPDCARSLAAGEAIAVRNPGAVRPWQHVLDCLSGYLLLGEKIAGVAKTSPLISEFNFGPLAADFRSVGDLVAEVLRHWPGRWEEVGQGAAGHEAGRLRLAIDKASDLLGWTPRWSFQDAVRETVHWYRRQAKGGDPASLRELSLEQIARYEAPRT